MEAPGALLVLLAVSGDTCGEGGAVEAGCSELILRIPELRHLVEELVDGDPSGPLAAGSRDSKSIGMREVIATLDRVVGSRGRCAG